MAIGMKGWAGMMAGGLLIVAVWTLPPSHEPPPGRQVAPEVARFQDVQRRYRTDLGILLARRWADSLSELTVRTAVDGIAAGIPMENTTPERYEAWVEDLRAMSRSLEPRDPEMLLGIYHLDPLHGAPEDSPAPSVPGIYVSATGAVFATLRATSFPGAGGGIYVGIRDGTPYCMIVEAGATSNPIEDGILRTLPPLEACRFYAQYGEPGARLAEWLEDGGMRFAIGSRRSLIPADAGGGTPTRPWWAQLDAPVFGFARLPGAADNPTLGRCLAGDGAACERFVTQSEVPVADWELRVDADLVANSPVAYTRRQFWRGAFGTGADHFLLLTLETQFGPEAFARFWRSDAELTEAFQSAFGADLGSWTMEYLRSEVGRHWAGPAVKAGTPAWVLLTLMALSAFVTLRAKRRQVG